MSPGQHLWHHRTWERLEGAERVRQETDSIQVKTLHQRQMRASVKLVPVTCIFLEASFQGQTSLAPRDFKHFTSHSSVSLQWACEVGEEWKPSWQG